MDEILQQFDEKYLQHAFNAGVGTILFLACAYYKIPQIILLNKTRSTKGLSLKGLSMELFCYSTSFLYSYSMGYDFITYCEYSVILVVQIWLIISYVRYTNEIKWMKSASFAMVYVCCFVIVVKGVLTREWLSHLVTLCTPISLSSKVIQILSIVKHGNSDNISIRTWFLSFLTNAVRIVTTCITSMDHLLLWNFSLSSLLSLLVCMVVVYYKPKTE